jgi:hypothetical protein
MGNGTAMAAPARAVFFRNRRLLMEVRFSQIPFSPAAADLPKSLVFILPSDFYLFISLRRKTGQRGHLDTIQEFVHPVVVKRTP